jgi:hypothetical protein
MMTAALGTKAPDASVICPTMFPVMTWHGAAVEETMIPANTQNKICFIGRFPRDPR